MKQSRRNLLKSFGALSVGCFGAHTASARESQKFDSVYDVIVVGSGVAGTIATISAAEKGASVLLIEKMSRLGGTSRISGLNFACVNSPAQKAKGIQDSPEKLATDMFKVSGGMGNYQMALEMARNTARVEKFLTDHGVQWDGRLLKLGGHSVPRVLISKGDGAGLLGALWQRMESLKNVKVLLHTKADEIIINEKGEAVGVQAREGYFFDTPETDDLLNKTGTSKRFGARQGVIFATGGYARDKNFRSIEVPFLAGVATTTNPGATSGSLKSLIRAGAQSVHTSLFRFAYPLPTEDMIWGVMIDPATGERFMSEGSTRNTLAMGVLNQRLKNGDKKPFMIYDEKALAKFHNLNRVQRSLNGLNGVDGTMYKFDSLAELCRHYGAEESKVCASLSEYNQLIKNGKDSVFDKPLERSGRQVEPIDEKGPFYAIVISPRLNYTPGGVRTDTKGRALRLADGQPIPGLYVVGEAAGGLHGQERMTACSMPDCSVFGLIAAEHAANSQKRL